MPKINFAEPCTLEEVRAHYKDAHLGYAAADNRVYSRHVGFLMGMVSDLENKALFRRTLWKRNGESYARQELEHLQGIAREAFNRLEMKPREGLEGQPVAALAETATTLLARLKDAEDKVTMLRGQLGKFPPSARDV